MFKPYRNVVPAEGFRIAAPKPSHELLEARQESQILTTCALSPYLRAYDFKVTVCRGNATLSGNVAEDASKELAGQIALGVGGIKSVDNQIEVNSHYSAPARSAERGFGEIVDDASITWLVMSKLLWSRHADDFAAKVETTRGKVKLSGAAHSSEAKDAAGMLASNTLGVSAVDNQIMVEAQKPRAVKEEATDIADTLDHHEGEIHLHVLHQCEWLGYRGQHRQWCGHVDRQDGQRRGARVGHRAGAQCARRQECEFEPTDDVTEIDLGAALERSSVCAAPFSLWKGCSPSTRQNSISGDPLSNFCVCKKARHKTKRAQYRHRMSETPHATTERWPMWTLRGAAYARAP